MRHRLMRLSICSILLLLILGIAGCGILTSKNARLIRNGSTSIDITPTNTPGSSTPSTGAIDAIAARVLTNMHNYSWNRDAVTQGVTTGGLVINWEMSNPTVINMVTAGADGNPLHNHDPQVDLLYLTSLADYVQLHATDKTYAGDLQRMSAFVHGEFQQYNLPKGWIYFDLLKVAQITQNAILLKDAYNTAQNFYNNWYDPRLGFVYDNQHIPGDYDPNHILQCGAALIDAGTRWHQAMWIKAGQSTIDHVLAVALDPTYHLFYNNMTVSYNGHDSVQNAQAKPSTQGEAADALLTAYTLTHQQRYLDIAKQLLSTTFSSGLWDASQQGFFFALDMSNGKLLKDYKETRSQTLMLVALHHYNQIQPSFTQQEQLVTSNIINHFYEPTYGGFFYRVSANFQVYVSRSSTGTVVEDYFTTEAMGSAVDALLQVQQSIEMSLNKK